MTIETLASTHYVITVTEVKTHTRPNGEGYLLKRHQRTETFRQVVETIDMAAVSNAVNGTRTNRDA